MNDLQNWLISKIPTLVPCHLPQIKLGTDRLSLKFENGNEKSNPLSLGVQSVNENNEFTDYNLNLTLSGGTPETQFTKRLENTPYYISSLTCDNYNLYLIDFYQWIPVTTIYRIFYFHSVKHNAKIDLRISTSIMKNVSETEKFEDWYLLHSGDVKKEAGNELVAIDSSETYKKSQVFILSVSENQSHSDDLSVRPILEKLSKLESTVKAHHILLNLKIQNKKQKQLVDELWSQQKGLNPDRKHSRSNSLVGFTELWNNELCRYMGWIIPKNNTKTTFVKILKDADPIKEFFYKAFFADFYTTDDIIESLQTWWDQYSLPLYRMKLRRTIQKDPSLIFVIYSLALQMQLPWSEQLYKMSNSFFHEPQIALLASLFQIAILKVGKDDKVRVIPGSGQTGNVGSVSRGDIKYAYTRFSSSHFTIITKNNAELFKINKRVILSHNKNLDQLTITPPLQPVNLDRLHTNSISIQIDNLTVNIPLLWKNSELTFPGCRIRWIFKKDRFQFTCQAKKPGINLKIDNHIIDFSHSNHTRYYHPVKKLKQESCLNLYDCLGRSYIMEQKSPQEKINLVGWIQDPYGLFVEKYNLVIYSHHIPFVANQSGLINTSLDINTKLDRIGVISKKRAENIPIRKITSSLKIKLMTYLDTASRGTLVIVIDDELKINKEESEKLFISTLGFIPLIYYRSEMKKKINLPFLIFIGEKESLSRIREVKGLSNSSVLSIKYPEGIIHLFKILSDLS